MSKIIQVKPIFFVRKVNLFLIAQIAVINLFVTKHHFSVEIVIKKMMIFRINLWFKFTKQRYTATSYIINSSVYGALMPYKINVNKRVNVP